jgi:CheY-like chemotaxis protein
MHDWNDLSTWAILLVDDEIDNLEVVAETLRFYGAEVKTADGGTRALEILKTFTPTLVLTDLSMPGVDGWQLRVKIRQLPEMQDAPIIALSAHAMLGDKERVLDAGFDGYMTKPIDVRTLPENMRKVLQEQMALRALAPVSVTATVETKAVTPDQVANGATPSVSAVDDVKSVTKAAKEATGNHTTVPAAPEKITAEASAADVPEMEETEPAKVRAHIKGKGKP